MYRKVFSLSALVISMILAIALYFSNRYSYYFLLIDLLCLLILLSNYRITSFVVVYFSYLFISHTGIFYIDILGIELNRYFYEGSLTWIRTNEYYQAKMLSSIAFIAFTISGLINPIKIINKHKNRSLNRSLSSSYNKKLQKIGLMILILTTLYLFVISSEIIFNYGINYLIYRREVKSYVLYPWVIFFFAIGFIFSITSNEKIIIKPSIIFFSIGGILLLLTGNRGEVFFPIFAAAPIIFSSKKVKILKLLILVLAILLLLNFIFLNRSGASETNNSISVIHSIGEIGFTMRSLENTLSYFNNGTFSFGYGGSFLVPVANIILKAISFGMISLDVSTTRFYLKEFFPRQGYSILAESYYNFGVLGIVVIMSIISAILTYFSDAKFEKSDLAGKGAVLAILINNVRNFSYFIPGQLLMVFILLTISRTKIR